jgi:hypothetical protein
VITKLYIANMMVAKESGILEVSHIAARIRCCIVGICRIFVSGLTCSTKVYHIESICLGPGCKA